jgi:hypothetical protein
VKVGCKREKCDSAVVQDYGGGRWMFRISVQGERRLVLSSIIRGEFLIRVCMRFLELESSAV